MTVSPQKISYLQHFTLWLFMYLFIFDYHFLEGNWVGAITWTSVEIFFYLCVFYFNYLVNIPLFLQKGKVLLYIISIIIFLLAYVALIKSSGVEPQLYSGSFWRNNASMTINFTLFWLISTLYWSYRNQWEKREIELRIRAEKLEMEMKFLKAQMSPHFIFNTLNNIYSLVQQSHENAGPMLTKLSGILRYLLYDASHENVSLQKELDTVQQYIELQQLRELKSQNIDFYFENNGRNPKIAPLVLLNFVENCFKHSNIEQSEDAWIRISCILNEEHVLHLSTENSVNGVSIQQKETGIGNRNIRRQLELHYPLAHQLTTSLEKDVFIANLKLILQQ